MTGGNPVVANSTHVRSPANHVSKGYQKARINVFVNAAHRHQLDVLSREWDVPLVETVRRVLNMGLRGIMQADNTLQ